MRGKGEGKKAACGERERRKKAARRGREGKKECGERERRKKEAACKGREREKKLRTAANTDQHSGVQLRTAASLNRGLTSRAPFFNGAFLFCQQCPNQKQLYKQALFLYAFVWMCKFTSRVSEPAIHLVAACDLKNHVDFLPQGGCRRIRFRPNKSSRFK